MDPAEVEGNISLAEVELRTEVELRKPRNLFVCVSEEGEDREQGEREGEGTQGLSLSSGTHRIHNSLTENADRMPGVELREPRNLCVCVSEECGYGEGVGVLDTLITDTRRRVVSLAENSVRMPGVELREPRNLCVCESEECGHGEGVGVLDTLITFTRRRVVSLAESAVRMSGVDLREPRNLCV
jgi:uncharacterized membrane protein YqjE